MAKKKSEQVKKVARIYVAQPHIRRDVVAKSVSFDAKERALFGVSEVNTLEGSIDLIPLVVFPHMHQAVDVISGVMAPYEINGPNQRTYIASVEPNEEGDKFIFTSGIGAQVTVPIATVKKNFGDNVIEFQ